MPLYADTATDQAARALLQQFASETNPRGIQKLALMISDNYSARKLLKTSQYKALGQKYFEAWLGQGAMAQRMLGMAKSKMGHYPQDVLDRVQLISNESSRLAKSPPMDFDVGAMTYNRDEARVLLDHLGGPRGVERFHKDLQRALEESYLELAQEIGGSGIYVEPKRAFITATTAWHPEAYGDPKVLLKHGVPSEALIQQTADVTKYKAWEMRDAAARGLVSADDAMEEVARGTLKDVDKVNRVFNRLEKLLGQKLAFPDEVQQIIAIYRDLNLMRMSPSDANAAIQAATGGKFNIWTSAEHVADQMEAAWRLRPRRPNEALLNLFAEFLDDANYDKVFKAMVEGNIAEFPDAARKIIDEIDTLARVRLTQLQPGSVRGTLERIAREKLGDVGGLLKNPNSDALQSILQKMEGGQFEHDDIVKLFGPKRAGEIAEIRTKLTPEIKAKAAAKFAKGKFAIWDVDRETSRILLGNADSTLHIDTTMGAAMGIWQTAMIMDMKLTPEEESRQLLNAWGTALPIVGDVAQGLIEGVEWAYDDSAPTSKLFKSAAWLSIGAAGVVPGAQAYALIAGLTLMTYELGSSYFDISKDKSVIEAWIASGVWDEKTGKLNAIKDADLTIFPLDNEKPATFQKLLLDGAKPYKEGLKDVAIRDSILQYAERSFLDRDEGVQSYIRGLKTLYSDFDFKTALRLPIQEARDSFGRAISRAGGKPDRSAEMLMFMRAKRIYDGSGVRAASSLKAQAEAEYQARGNTGEALKTFQDLEALGKRLGVPLRQHVEDIFKAFSNYTLETIKSPWVRESMPRRRVQLAEQYLQGYLQIEKTWQGIVKIFGDAGIKAPSHNLTGYLEIDAPRMKDLEAAYSNRAIREVRQQVESLHREANGDSSHRFNAQQPDPCDAELFKTLSGIMVRIVDAEDRRLLLQQWAGNKTAAETSRDEKLRIAQKATEDMKKSVEIWIPGYSNYYGPWKSSAGALPGQLWDGMADSFSAAYAWTNVQWEGAEVYGKEASGVGERIERLKVEYDKAVEAGKQRMLECVKIDLKGQIELSSSSPRKGDTVSASAIVTNGKAPANAIWQWQGSSGVTVNSSNGNFASLTAQGKGGIKVTILNALKQRIGEFSAFIDVLGDDEKKGDKDKKKLPTHGAGGSASGQFPGEPFNGMQISYSVSGCSLPKMTDSPGFGTYRNYEGRLGSGSMTVSGTARMGGGFGADVSVTVSAGGKSETFTQYLKYPGNGGFSSASFNLIVPIPPEATSASFSIKMDGHYSMGGGWRGLGVSGSCTADGPEGPAPKGSDDLSVDLNGPSTPIPIGKEADVTANAKGGRFPYSYAWTGATGSAERAKAKITRPGSQQVAVTVSDSEGKRAGANLTIKVEPLKLELAGLPGQVYYGSRSQLQVKGLPDFAPTPAVDPCAGRTSSSHNPYDECATVTVDPSKAVSVAPQWDGVDLPAIAPDTNAKYAPLPANPADKEGAYRFVWQSEPGLTIEPPTSSDGTTWVTYDRMGQVKVWCEVLQQIDGAWQTIGETDQKTVNVVAPAFTINFTPPDGQGKIGQEVRAKIVAKPEVPAKLIDYRWFEPASSNRMEYADNAGEIGFKVKDAKPMALDVLARSPHYGDEIAKIKGSYAGVAYDVKIGPPKARGPQLQVWVCDTQLGNARNCGMKDIPQGQFATFQDIFMQAEVTPAPASPRYRWSVNPSGSCGLPGAGSELHLNCSSTGSYTVHLEVLDADNILLGQADGAVSVSVSDNDVRQAPKSKEAYDKMQQAKQKANDGQLDEAIGLAVSAAALDPKNSEAKDLGKRWNDERQNVRQQVDRAKKALQSNKPDDAQKEIDAAKKLHPKYPPVLDAEKQLADKRKTLGQTVTGGSTIQPLPPEDVSRPAASKLVLEDDKGPYQWVEGTEVQTQQIHAGRAAFRSTGNNHFTHRLGIVGNYADQYRYLDFWIYLKNPSADIQLQAQVDGAWGKRWGFDGDATYNGYGWAMEGTTAGLPSGRWLHQRLDLMQQLHIDAGQTLTGLAFSSDGGDVYYDSVYLIPGGATTSLPQGALSGKRVLEDDAGPYSWVEKTSVQKEVVAHGKAAFRSTGNNHFAGADLGVVGDYPEQFRSLNFWLFPIGAEADLQLQVQVDGVWGKRWGYDAGPKYNGYGWTMEGTTTGLKPGQWQEVSVDLLNQLHINPGQKITGLAFSSDNGDVYYDSVYLRPNSSPALKPAFQPVGKRVLEDDAGGFNWADATELQDFLVFHGSRAFRSNGNDHFLADLGVAGNGSGQFRSLGFWAFFMGPEADLQVQVQVNGSWGKRWGYDAGPKYNGYDWTMEGTTTGMANGRWTWVQTDLLNQLHLKAGDRITGLAFSSDNADVAYDSVYLLPSGTGPSIVAGSQTGSAGAQSGIGGSLRLDRTVYAPGESIAVHFTAPGTWARDAWVGIFK